MRRDSAVLEVDCQQGNRWVRTQARRHARRLGRPADPRRQRRNRGTTVTSATAGSVPDRGRPHIVSTSSERRVNGGRSIHPTPERLSHPGGLVTVTADRPVNRADLAAAIVMSGYTVLA